MASPGRLIDIGHWRKPIHQDLIPLCKPDRTMQRLLSALRERLRIEPHIEPTLGGAVSHLLDNAGSMVRPRIVYQLAKTYGLHDEPATDLAIALEYFHTASLVFDDLPCMDDATERRGATCVHVVYGQSAAILAALALINQAYALAWRAIASCAPQFRAPSLAYLGRHLGTQGLLNGQSLDLNFSKLPHTADSTARVAQGKTVSLISLTLVLPAMAGGASPRELQLLHRISTSWGLSYQIVDDLKDVLENSSTSGKTTARDLSLGRPNMALAIGIGGSLKRLRRLIRVGDANLALLLKLRPSAAFLHEFRQTLEDELNRTTKGVEAIPISKER